MSVRIRTYWFISLLAALVLTPLFSNPVYAAFNKHNLIDDFVFNRTGTMTSTQIDSFLNRFDHSCISTESGFQARIPSGYSPSGGFTYGSYGSAGQVISTISNVYDLNPQVLIVTLEKEQSLVTGRNSGTYCAASNGNHKYASAMGYGCPDSGTSHSYTGLDLYRRNGTTQTKTGTTCVNTSAKAGFSQQVVRGAWLLKFGQQRSLGNVDWAIVEGSWDNSDDLAITYSGPMTQGTRKRCSSCSATFFDGYTTIDGASTHMDTGATAALYWYTPHIHGNQLFVGKFEEWFGSTRSNPLKTTLSRSATSESGDQTVIQFSLVAQPSADVTVPLAISDSTEAMLGSGVTNIVIAAANWNKPASNQVTVTGKDDADRDGDVKYRLVTGDPTSTDNAYGNLTAASVADISLVNNDNEPDIELVGDWNGDGRDDVGLRRGNTFMLNYEKDGRTNASFMYGQPSDTALVGDWNGDGRDDIGLKRGHQYLLNFERDGRTNASFEYGTDTDVPVVGDWDKDGRDEIGLRRGRTFLLNYEMDGRTNKSFDYGMDGDIPIVGDWNKDGWDDIGLQRANKIMLNYEKDGRTNKSFDYGLADDTYIVGDWNGDKRGDVGIRRDNLYMLNYEFDGRTNFSFRYGR